NFLPEYVYLCLKSKDGLQNIIDRSFGSVRQTLRFEDLCTISIPNISLEKQQQIVNNAQNIYQIYIAEKKKLDNFDVEKELLSFEKNNNP
ncbi:MAG: hypothetical protein LBD53_11095, partial [Tannerella sp.]|nr:hypothetical protein [Tannerella sp.]